LNLLFATGSDRKLAEASAACEPLGINVEQTKLEITEIQSEDPMIITEHKISEAYRLAQKPIVVTDTSWSIPSLNGFPGGYMKDICGWFKPNDFLALMSDKSDKRISFTETIIYKDKNLTKVFAKQYWGEVASAPAGTGNSIEVVAQFDGFTIGQKRDKGELSHDPKDYIWNDFATWYASLSAE